jgi:hypothetical protein
VGLAGAVAEHTIRRRRSLFEGCAQGDGVHDRRCKHQVAPVSRSRNATLANKLTAELCGNIKAAGVTVYTVAYDVTDATIQDLLLSCSSGPPYSYSATTTSDLQAAFASIANQLVSVRLTK